MSLALLSLNHDLATTVHIHAALRGLALQPPSVERVPPGSADVPVRNGCGRDARAPIAVGEHHRQPACLRGGDGEEQVSLAGGHIFGSVLEETEVVALFAHDVERARARVVERDFSVRTSTPSRSLLTVFSAVLAVMLMLLSLPTRMTALFLGITLPSLFSVTVSPLTVAVYAQAFSSSSIL